MEHVLLLPLAFFAAGELLLDDLAAQVQEEIAEYDAAHTVWYEEYLESQGSQEVVARMPDSGPVGTRLLEIVADEPSSDAAFVACQWVLTEVMKTGPLSGAVSHVTQHLGAHERIGELVPQMLRAADYCTPAVRDDALRWILEQAQTEELAAQACLQLAVSLKFQFLAHLNPDDARSLEAEADEVFALCLSERFASIPVQGEVTIGDRARAEIFELKNLCIGKVAPDIVGEDLEGVPLELGDYRGKVVMLSFWGDW